MSTDNPISKARGLYHQIEDILKEMGSGDTVCIPLDILRDLLTSLEVGIEALMHPEDLRKMPYHFQRLETLSDGQVVPIEYRMRHADGSWRWIYAYDTVFPARCRWTRQTDPELGTGRDGVQKKQKKSLRESEERFRAIVDSICGRIWRYVPGQPGPDPLSAMWWGAAHRLVNVWDH